MIQIIDISLDWLMPLMVITYEEYIKALNIQANKVHHIFIR